MLRDTVRNPRTTGSILTTILTILLVTGNAALANIVQPEISVAKDPAAIEDTREILARASQITLERTAALQQSSGMTVDATTADLLANYMASFIYVPHAMALPADEDALDEPWLASGSGATNEDGMVVPNLDDDAVDLDTPGNNASLRFLKPIQNALVTSPFGWRWGRPHQGIDLGAPLGTPILSAERGTVVYAGWKQGYGNFVAVDHGHGYETHYAHCSKIIARVGQHVTKGQLIAKVGSTGRSTGPHLHFEVVADGIHRNPIKFLNRTVAVVKADK